MPTITDLKAKLALARKDIEAKLPTIVSEFAHSAKVLAERNIINDGFGAEYSKNEVPAFFFLGKELNNTGKKFIQQKIKKGEGMTWMALRDAQGLPTDHVTLSYSNEMWRGIVVIEVKKPGTKIIAMLGSTTKSGKDKMMWNFDRYGDFILKALGLKEKDFLAEQATDDILTIIKRHI